MREFSAILRTAGAVAAIVAATIVAAIGLTGAPTAHAQSPTANETASLTPLDPVADREGARLEVLSSRDARLYSEIFVLQEAGDWAGADSLIARLEDPVLMGHVLFQRYMHPTAYRSRFAELRDWLADHADHPGAERIFRLAERRKPRGAAHPPRPVGPDVPAALLAVEAETVGPGAGVREHRPTGPNARAVRTHQRRIAGMVGHGYVTRALAHLEDPAVARLFDPASFDQSLGDIARGYFIYNKDREAFDVAARAANRSGAAVPIAHWWAGLAAWRLGDFDAAAEHFEALARNERAVPWSQAAGGFWAARAYLVGGRPERVNEMLRLSTNHPRTFYGLLAVRALGLTPAFDWTPADGLGFESDLLMRLPAARRAIALIQAGQRARAGQELRRFAQSESIPLKRVVLALADRVGLAEVAFRLGSQMERRTGERFDAALFPLPDWRPSEGFRVDRALIYAFVRQESRFKADAVSSAGARGLMQLMPATAAYMAGERLTAAAKRALFDPAVNLELGQRYLEYLIEDPATRRNLFFIAAAYNGGPGNLRKWRDFAGYNDDPLLFIESIPSRETRIFIERVLTNLWVYRFRTGQPAPSLDAVLSGDWPLYSPLDAQYPPVTTVAWDGPPHLDPAFALSQR